MKKILILLMAFNLSNMANSKTLKDSIPENVTKLEQFTAKSGVVIIRGFHKIGVLKGLYRTSVTIEVKEFSNVTDGTKQYGITIETFKENGNYDKDHTSFIDYDEIDSLIKGIEYIAKINGSVTKLESFQADYKTKGDLKISTFSSSDKIIAAVTSGTIGGVAGYLKIEDLPKLVDLLTKAKEKIISIK